MLNCALPSVVVCAFVCSGVVFAGVHDSFWTHAGSVARMNQVLREKFVELHHRQVGVCVLGGGLC